MGVPSTHPHPHGPGGPNYRTSSTSGASIASLVLGIIAWVSCVGPVTGIPAIICGHIGLAKIRKWDHVTGKGLAVWGLILGYLATLIPVVIIGAAVWIHHKEEQAKLSRIEPKNAHVEVVLPAGHPASDPIPGAIWLHGYGSDASELAYDEETYQKLADKLRIAWIAIDAPLPLPESGYEWAEDAEIDFQYLRDVLALHESEVKLKWPDVVLFGFSQGAMTAGNVAGTYPDEFRGAILFSPGGHRFRPDLPDVSGPPHREQMYFCFVGELESEGNVQLTERFAEELEGLGSRVIHRVIPDVEDHTLPPDFDSEIGNWIDRILKFDRSPDS